jgi:hypothetical protein
MDLNFIKIRQILSKIYDQDLAIQQAIVPTRNPDIIQQMRQFQ